MHAGDTSAHLDTELDAVCERGKQQMLDLVPGRVQHVRHLGSGEDSGGRRRMRLQVLRMEHVQ